MTDKLFNGFNNGRSPSDGVGGRKPDYQTDKFKPKRIQRKRTKGWRMPPNTVSITRPGKWGNPFRVVKYSDGKWAVKTDGSGRCGEVLVANCHAVYDTKEAAIADAIMCYEIWLPAGLRQIMKEELRCKNVACFCPLDQPCHGDIILKIANE